MASCASGGVLRLTEVRASWGASRRGNTGLRDGFFYGTSLSGYLAPITGVTLPASIRSLSTRRSSAFARRRKFVNFCPTNGEMAFAFDCDAVVVSSDSTAHPLPPTVEWMGKHSRASRAKWLLAIGASLFLFGLVLLTVNYSLEGDVAPPLGQPTSNAETLTAIAAIISALAGLITSLVGLVTVLNARRTTKRASP